MRTIALLMASALALAACAQQPKMIYLRADGQRGSADPVLAQQFEMDRTVCAGDMQKANLSGVTVVRGGIAGMVAAQERADAVGTVARGCMAEKGYVMVREDEAEARAAELAAINAEKKRREVAVAQPKRR